MNRSDFQRLADMRLREAKALLDSKNFEGAYYLAGYAVECAIKAYVAKQTKQFDFPDRELVNRVYKHDPNELIRGAGLDIELQREIESSKQFNGNWGEVKDWSEETRYEIDISEQKAQDLYDSIADPEHGVFQWLKRFW